MKKIFQQLKFINTPFRGIGIILLLLAFRGPVYAQTYGGEIKAKNNPGVIGDIKRTNDGLKTADSAVLAKLNASIAVTGTFWQATQPVSGTIAFSNTTIAVTNAGTFAVQVDGSALTALQLIDDNMVAQATALGTTKNALMGGSVTTAAPSYTTGNINPLSLTTAGALRVDNSAVTQPVSGTLSITANSAVNVAQINGVTTLMGNGTTGTGSQRVTIASDNTAFSVNPLSATAPVSTMNSASANSGLNSAMAGVFDDASPTAITENSFGFIRMSANRNLFGTIRDAAGNERGANVNASNQLSVSVDNTVTVGSHAVTNAGTFAVQVDGSALTALQLIDDNMVAQSTALGTTKNALIGGSVTTAAPSYTTGNINPLSLTTAGALRVDNSAVTQPVSGTVSITANSAVNVAQINGVTTLMGNGVTGTGSQRVTLASDMTAISTTGYMSVKLDQTTPGTTNGVSLVPTTTGGLTTYHLVSAGSTNATNVKASAGQLYGYYIFNANAAARKIAFHNTSGTPTAGASIFFSIVIPAGSGANVEFSQAIAFSSGIGITTVTGTADSDATGVASGDLIINLFYK